MENCIFCKIVQGEIPAAKVYEDDETFAFLDIGPTNPGHTLVIPKSHATDIYNMSDESIASTFKMVKRIASAVKVATGASGINVHMNNEKTAGQVVFHAHVHVIPRFENDGLVHWGHRSTYKTGEDEALAEKIRNFL